MKTRVTITNQILLSISINKSNPNLSCLKKTKFFLHNMASDIIIKRELWLGNKPNSLACQSY